MRTLTLGYERRALVYAKTMLLVGYDEGEFVKLHAVADKRVGADYEARLAALDRFDRFAFLSRGHRASEFYDLNVKGGEQLRKGLEVLVCKDLGRCHDTAQSL